MNTTENKHLLWELTKDLYSPGMDRARVIEMFESTVLEVDVGDEPLLEKNKLFLARYVEKIAREVRKPQEEILIQLAHLQMEVREIKQLLKKT